MKRLTYKIIVVTMIMLMLLPMMGTKILANANEEVLSIKKDETTYFLYIKEVLNSKFEFAFSKENNGTNLDYISSIEDNQGNNIAYVDETLKSTYFNQNITYLWVKENSQIILNGVQVNLGTSKTEEQLQSIKNITNKITVNSDADEDKIKINGDTSKKYYYEMYAVASSEDYQRLLELVDEVSKYTDDTNTYTKIETYGELYDLYNKLLTDVSNSKWIEATNLEIDKPYDAKENQKYILWLKDENGQIDFQVLTAYKKEVTNTEEKNVTVEVKSKLPVTYDETIALCVVLAVIIIAIIVMLLVRRKISSTNKRK
ncbi:MAG: hypothetical protein ACI4VH_07215 [Clostridia bacterium]